MFILHNYIWHVQKGFPWLIYCHNVVLNNSGVLWKFRRQYFVNLQYTTGNTSFHVNKQAPKVVKLCFCPLILNSAGVELTLRHTFHSWCWPWSPARQTRPVWPEWKWGSWWQRRALRQNDSCYRSYCNWRRLWLLQSPDPGRRTPGWPPPSTPAAPASFPTVRGR